MSEQMKPQDRQKALAARVAERGAASVEALAAEFAVSAETVRRDVTADEVEAVREVMRRFTPGADGPLRASVVCLYTNTPDEHFWIDRYPAHPQVLVASPCSGHGFKFSPVIGEILADLVQAKPTRFDLSLFRWRGVS